MIVLKIISKTTVENLISEVARKYGITVERLKARDRERLSITARQEACYRLRIELKLTYREICRFLSWKYDPSTVLKSIESHKERYAIAKMMVGKEK